MLQIQLQKQTNIRRKSITHVWKHMIFFVKSMLPDLVVPIEVEQEQSSIFLNNTWHENEHFCYFFIYLFSILIYSQGKREDRNWLDNLCTLFILDCRFQRQNDFGRILHDLIYIYVIVVTVFWFIKEHKFTRKAGNSLFKFDHNNEIDSTYIIW